jgi:NAD(P)-dependent dehydrogenase (short-subunit alcohol dehydrogenase family)
MEPFSLTGRTAIVTGASRGIGAAAAQALDRAGARVALVARSRADLEEVARQLEHDPIVVVGDLRHAQTPIDVGTQAIKALGQVDILVNNAAAAARLDTVDSEAEAIDEMLAVNIRAPLLLIATVIPSMIERHSGSIINLSSVSALVGTPRRAAYAASKGGLDAATRSLAMELGPSGIRVNSVAPGRHGPMGQEPEDSRGDREDRGADPVGSVGHP